MNILTLAIGCLLSQAEPDKYDQLTGEARIIFPGGSATSGERWGNLFSTGYGFEADYSHLWHAADKLHLGLYGGISYDTMSGKSVDVPPLTIKPDPLQTVGLEVGGKARETFGSIFIEENLGIGLAYYLRDDATFSGPGGSVKGEAIKATATYLVDFGARFGVVLSDKIEAAIGTGFQWNGAPKAGSAFVSGFSFKGQQNVIVTVGLNISF